MSWGIGSWDTSSDFPPLRFQKKVDVLNAGLREHIINLEDLRLWEIWYTGPTPFPSEVSPSLTSSLGLFLTDTADADAQPCSSRQHRFRSSSASEFPFSVW